MRVSGDLWLRRRGQTLPHSNSESETVSDRMILARSAGQRRVRRRPVGRVRCLHVAEPAPKSPNLLMPGQRLVLPLVVLHLVLRGSENRTETIDAGASSMTGRLSRGETRVFVHCTFINLMKVPNVETLIFLVPASNHFMF